MKKLFSIRFVFFTASIAAVLLSQSSPCSSLTTTSSSPPYPVIWATSGGGWRAMMTNVGYANALAQAGLFGADLNEPSSQLMAFSGSSGGIWFALQFFYSTEFFQRTIDSNLTGVRSLVVDWMESYVEFLENVQSSTAVCHLVEWIVPSNESDLASSCAALTYYEGYWANYTQDMLNAAARTYGETTAAPWSSQPVTPAARVSALAATDLYTQITMATNVRTPANTWASKIGDTISYLGPQSSSDQVYTVALPFQYAIRGNQSYYKYAVKDEDLPFRIYVGRAPQKFHFSDWRQFYLYPASDGGKVLTQNLPNRAQLSSRSYLDPFGGHIPTVAALAGSSGAAGALGSGLMPSLVAQYASLRLKKHPGLAVAQARGVYDQLKILQEAAVCAQWPARCSPSDFRFLDGGLVDTAGLALTMGQLQQRSPGLEIGTPLKVILTYNKYYTDTSTKILSYFQTPYNQNISPGDYVWPPGTAPSYSDASIPIRSPQIFQDYMDETALQSALEVTQEGGLAIGLYRNLTTVENSPYGVKAGFQVDILLLQINSTIPTAILGFATAAENVESLADLTISIAENKMLVDRIVAFAYGS